ncbi:hypothetical protein PV10_03475 [Exophiala mesophila]|uniref:Uncharacterized protein n=1 Tax=Exophiala mesophila TaxID=212818 RepID=A0A0D2AAB8_EXOME|nr:uncharacterized protein PV10_03475 [Exophiala mesophila]KIV95873.1 hypothetical protein PV10_03475 [Exophiala mesophila]
MRRPYKQGEVTGLDLYAERDAIPFYYRAVTLAASWLVLGGYAVFAIAFTTQDEHLKPSRVAVVSLAVVMTFLGYVIGALGAFFSSSLLFTQDAVLLPFFTSSAVGLFISVANHASQKDLKIPSEAYVLVPLIASGVATIITGLFTFIVSRKIRGIRKSDQRRGQHVQRWDHFQSVSYGDATSTSELLPMDTMQHTVPVDSYGIPEDEAQRRQLLRLLLNREPVDSPLHSGTPSTYRINLPGEDNDLAQLLPQSRTRTGSLPSSSNKSTVFTNLKFLRTKSPPLDNSVNSREKRREEIERSSISYATPSLGSGGEWARTPGTSPGL